MNTSQIAQRPLLSVAQAAALVGVSEATAYRWLAAGELPGAVKVHGRWYVRSRVLEAWIEGIVFSEARPAA